VNGNYDPEAGRARFHEACGARWRQLDRELDAALRYAISARLGRCDWTIEEVNGRLDWIIFAGRSRPDTYLMDGELLLTAWAAEHSLNGNKLTITRKIAIADAILPKLP